MVSIFYLPIFLIPYKTHQRQAFWMMSTLKNLKILCVKFFDNIGQTLVTDWAYIIVHLLKSICRTLYGNDYQVIMQKCSSQKVLFSFFKSKLNYHWHMTIDKGISNTANVLVIIRLLFVKIMTTLNMGCSIWVLE